MADNKMERREFMKRTGVAGLGLAAIPSAMAFSSTEEKEKQINIKVNFTRDGLDFSPNEYSTTE